MDYRDLKKFMSDRVWMSQLITETEFLDQSQLFGTPIPVRQRLWHRTHNKYLLEQCVNCQIKPVTWREATGEYRKFCSAKCAQTSKSTRSKIEQTCLKKYGHRSNLQSVENQAKQRDTNLKKYGTVNAAASESVKKKIQTTFIEKYGSNPAQTPAVKQKCDETHLLRYGRKRSSQSHMSLDVINQKNNIELMRHWYEDLKMPVYEIAESLNIGVSQLAVHFKKNLNINIHRHIVSKPERELTEFLSQYVVCETSNRKLLAPKELDIVIASKQLAIELDGIAWHTELRGKSRMYHSNKRRAAADAGYRLINILDIEWIDKNAICKSRLGSILGINKTIGARHCTVEIVDHCEARAFLEANHIQGFCQSRVNLGLRRSGELVALMTMGSARYNKQAQWELLRYVNLLNNNVVGGASKLFKYFVKHYNPSSVISYCDLRWNTGRLYQQLGFAHVKDSGPNYWYVQNRKIESRVRFQKHRLSKLLQTFDPQKTEWENMVANGWDRYWDCGNGVWIWSR